MTVDRREHLPAPAIETMDGEDGNLPYYGTDKTHTHTT
jgi:hypothetical protein